MQFCTSELPECSKHGVHFIRVIYITVICIHHGVHEIYKSEGPRLYHMQE